MKLETNEYDQTAIEVMYSEYVSNKILHIDYDILGWPIFTLIEVDV